MGLPEEPYKSTKKERPVCAGHLWPSRAVAESHDLGPSDSPTLLLRDFLYHDLLCYPRALYINYHEHEKVDLDDGRDVYDRDEMIVGLVKRKVDRAMESFPRDVGPLPEACLYLYLDDGNGKTLTKSILREGAIEGTLGVLFTLLTDLGPLDTTYHNMSSGVIEDFATYCRHVIDAKPVGSKILCPRNPLQSLGAWPSRAAMKVSL